MKKSAFVAGLITQTRNGNIAWEGYNNPEKMLMIGKYEDTRFQLSRNADSEPELLVRSPKYTVHIAQDEVGIGQFNELLSSMLLAPIAEQATTVDDSEEIIWDGSRDTLFDL